MKKSIYMLSYLALLLLIAVSFYIQIKTISQGNPYEWLILGLIIVAGAGSYFLRKRMHKESWFIQQNKKP